MSAETLSDDLKNANGVNQSIGHLIIKKRTTVINCSSEFDSSTLFDREPRIWQLPYS